MARPHSAVPLLVCLLLVAFHGIAAAQAPTITAPLSPNIGTTLGGTQVQINGTNLQTVTSVTFDGVDATILGGPPDGTILVVSAPVHVAGAVNVVVTNPSDSATAVNGFTYLTPLGPAPTVSNVTPDKGTTLGGTPITITGTGFLTGATVQLGFPQAANVVVVNTTTITAVTQAGMGTDVPVIVTNPDAQTGMLPAAFDFVTMCDGTVTENCITLLQVNGGAPPAWVTAELLSTADGVQVSIVDNDPADVDINNADRYELGTGMTPASVITFGYKAAPGFDPVAMLSTGNIQSWEWDAVTRVAMVNLKPQATSWSSAGCVPPPGTCAPQATVDYTALALAVLIGFPGADPDFKLDLQGAFLSTNAQTFTAPTYNVAAGAFNFTVGAPSLRFDGNPNDTGSFSFFVTDGFIIDWWNVPNPDDLLNPANSLVIIGGSVVTPTITDVAATPTSQAGIKFAFSPYHYSIEEISLIIAPTVTMIGPVSGPTAGGTAVTITGANFRAGATVSIGGGAATSVVVVDDTTITAVTPAHGAGTGSVVVTNTDTSTDTLAGAFTFIAPPILNSIIPSSGKTAGGTAVTIDGAGFLAGASVTIGGVAATSVTVVNSTTITAVTGAHAAGAVNVVVTNPDLQAATLLGAFTYVPPPTLLSINPLTGTTAGGTAVTINGTGFLAGAAVTIGGVAATGVNVVNSTTITAMTGAHAAGVVNVVVTNTDGQAATLVGAFTYVAPPPPPAPSAPAPPANQAPTLTGLGSISLQENTTATIGFTVADDATAAGNLAVSASSSNTTLVPASGVALAGSGAARTLTVTPNEDREGETTITILLSDGELTTSAAVLVTVSSAPAPNPPGNLAGTANMNEVTFSWTPPSGGAVPTFYVLEGGTAPRSTTLPVVNTESRATSWTMTLPPGTYFFRVRSGNSAGTSGVSSEAMVSVATNTPVPGAPTGLVAHVVDTRVDLGWQRSTTGAPVELWQVELELAGTSDRRTFTIPGDILSVGGALPLGDYLARVRGVNSAGAGPASNDARFSVGEETGCTSDVPDPPVALPATVNDRRVTLSWMPPRNAAVARYRLLVGSAAGGADLAVLDLGPTTSFSTEAAPGTYHVTIVASNACGTSGPSNSVVVVVGTTTGPPAAPSNVRADVIGQRVTLAWDGVTGAASYLVEVGTTPGASNVVAVPVSGNMLTLAAPSGLYYVRVRAVGAGGTSAASAEIVVTVP